jgi:4-hydroxy-4-methyl-2-oxoglutarate aldolase
MSVNLAAYAFTELPTVTPDFTRPDRALVEAASRCQPATLHEAAGKIGALPSAIKPMAPGFKLCGPAFTVHGPGNDNLWLHRALVLAQPGDVLVAHVSGAHEAGYWGEIMSTMARERGLGGLLIDACVRDGELLGQIGLPVFARGLCLRGTGKDFGAIGWINAPVLIGDVTIHPGDLIVGDGDGVVALPRALIATAIEGGHRREAQEAEILKRLRAGEATLDIYGWNRAAPPALSETR